MAAETVVGQFTYSSGNNAQNKYDSSERRLALYNQQEHKISYGPAADSTTVVAVTKTLTGIHYTGSVVEVSVTPVTAPTGGDLAFTVDIKKSTGAGAFATILTGVVTVNSSSANRTAQYATLSGTPTLVRGDLLQIVVAVSGSTGTQGAGYDVTIRTRENPAA